MGYKALITFDLNNVTTTERTKFYEKLEELQWYMVGHLTTTWKCEFDDSFSRHDAAKVVISDLLNAKRHSKMIHEVEYAFQMDKIDITFGNIKD